MPQKQYDVVIVGAGQAAIPLASALAQNDWEVAIAEQEHLGGSCVNYGCTPTKAVLASARVAHLARRGQEFGLTIPEVKVDFPAVLRRARDIASDSRQSLRTSLSESDNPVLLRGHAAIGERQNGTFRLNCDGERVLADQVILNTGSRSRIPDIGGLKDVDFITAENWLSHEELPEHIAILGGGPVGLEMGQFYRRMGSRVTIIERGNRILEQEDQDISDELMNLLQNEGIEFRLNAMVTRVRPEKDRLMLSFNEKDSQSDLACSDIFVATGRLANTTNMGLEHIGVRLTDSGFVDVDETLQTSVKGVWAAGDIRGGPMFTHSSYDDYRILLSQLSGEGERRRERLVPYAVFTDPELGRVGMTEDEAKQSGRRTETLRFDMKKNGRANEIGETDGFIKVTIDADRKRILGAAILSAEAAELTHLFVEAMIADISAEVIRDAIHIHPTLSEAVQSCVAQL